MSGDDLEADDLRDLRAALRRLLLPVAPQLEKQAVAAAAEALADRNIASADWAVWIDRRVDDWRDDPEAGPGELAHVIRPYLEQGLPRHGAALARSLRSLHQDLLKQMDQPQAWALVSQAGLIASLLEVGRMSAAQMSVVLAARLKAAPWHWETIQRVIDALGVEAPALTPEAVDAVRRDDEVQLAERFGDAGPSDGVEILEDVARRLGVPGDLGRMVSVLMQPVLRDESKFVSHAQILEFQLVVCELFDHPPTVAYEFNPRGEVAAAIYSSWPPEHRATASPILNNAKGTYALSKDWARGRKKAVQPSALALVDILVALEAMPFHARRELASWLRAWLLRAAELISPMERDCPELTPEGAARVLEAVASGETNTHGIIEQRVVDALAMRLHPEDSGWRSRGVGDSVFAPNYFRRKLGDCDFQHPDQRSATAYEAHAGHMTETYLDAHLSTLRRVLPARLDEWSGIADPSEWDLTIRVIAHSHAADLYAEGRLTLDPQDYFEVDADVELVTFAEAVSDAGDSSHWIDVYRLFVHEVMCSSSTRQEVFDAYCRLLEG